MLKRADAIDGKREIGAGNRLGPSSIVRLAEVCYKMPSPRACGGETRLRLEEESA
jgi:hypothetical protein